MINAAADTASPRGWYTLVPQLTGDISSPQKIGSEEVPWISKGIISYIWDTVSPSIRKKNTNMNNYTITWQFFVIFWALKCLSDLQLGDKKVTLNHLAMFFQILFGWWIISSKTKLWEATMLVDIHPEIHATSDGRQYVTRWGSGDFLRENKNTPPPKPRGI